MVEYHQLVKKPQVSAWICISRRIKLILSCSLFGIIIGLIIHTAEKSISDMLDLELKYLPKANESDGWKETSVNRGQIFSAYLDTRPEQILEERHAVNGNEKIWAMIRIIAILDTDMADAPLLCIYKYKSKDKESNGDNSESFLLKRRRATRVKPVAVNENFGLRYAAFFVLCDLTVINGINDNECYNECYNDGNLPYEITIAPIDFNDFDQIKNDSFVPIRYSENGISLAEYSNNFMAVCVQVFHHNYDRVMNLIEFIEFYQMMGVDHFTFYNSSISPRVGEVLNYYKNKGTVTVLPWELPPYFIFEKTLRVDGIFAALNDCLYRSSFHKSYMYVAAVDVDEFIVPRIHDDFISMMQHLDPLGPADTSSNSQASFLFRNMFFYLMLDDDPVTLRPGIPKLFTQSKTMRWKEANPVGDRSKFIVRSRQTVELGNHRTWELRRTSSAFGRYKEVKVDLDIAASQHYRTCETHDDTCWQRQTIRDRTAHRFTSALGERVAEACKNIFKNVCPEG